jgi:hypothetical protein
MAFPILGEIERLIVEHGSSVVQKEHVALLKTKLELLKEQLVELEKKLSAKEEEANGYKEQLSRYLVSSEYAEESGALFKRRPSGGYGDTPTCPKCHSAMSSIGGPLPYTCGNPKCRQEAGFGKNKLQEIMSRLP